jgi:hypothetical protein
MTNVFESSAGDYHPNWLQIFTKFYPWRRGTASGQGSGVSYTILFKSRCRYVTQGRKTEMAQAGTKAQK